MLKNKSRRGRMPNGDANPIDIYVGKRIRLRRNTLGMSQEQLAEKLGLTFQQVQKYEKGINRVGASRLWDLSVVLDAPIIFFFHGLSKEETENSPAALNGSNINEVEANYDPMYDDEIMQLMTAFRKIKNPVLKESLKNAVLAASKTVYKVED